MVSVNELGRNPVPHLAPQGKPNIGAFIAIACGDDTGEPLRRKRFPDPILYFVSPQNLIRYIEINP
jgi:hypothetical protein